MAKRLLTRLEIVTRPDSGLAMPSGSSNGFSGSGCGVGTAWEDSSGYSQATRFFLIFESFNISESCKNLTGNQS